MERKTDFKSILNEIGNVGRTQNFYFALICYVAFFTGSFTMIYVFTAGDLNYRCYIDDCDKSDIQSTDYNPGWITYAVPINAISDLPEKCFMYELAYNRNKSSNDSCSAIDFNDESTIKCNKFVFETEEQTILTEFNLTCTENKWKLTLPGSIHGSGKFINVLIIGYFSDRFGRKKIFIASAIITSILAMAQMLSLNYWMFLAFMFLETFLGGSTFTTGLVLGLELVSAEYRTAVGSVLFAIGSTGTIYFGLAAMWVLNWKKLILLCYIPNFIVILYIWLLPESITWLQVKGRYQDIANVLLRIIKWNKIKVSNETRDILHNMPELMFETDLKPEVESKKSEIFPMRDIFRSRPMMMRMLGLAYCWFANGIIFFGLSLISVAIGGNKFTDFIIACAMEIPACALVTGVSNRVGRKTILCAAFLVSGSALLIYTFVAHIYWIKMILFMVGKFAITMSFCTIFIYTSELVPTYLRQSLIGVSSAFGRLGSMAAPQAPLLEVFMKYLSIYMFIVLALIGGLIAFQFPETLNCKLPDTIEEAIQIDKRSPRKSNVTT